MMFVYVGLQPTCIYDLFLRYVHASGCKNMDEAKIVRVCKEQTDDFLTFLSTSISKSVSPSLCK